jgi:hypothetical protein
MQDPGACSAACRSSGIRSSRDSHLHPAAAAICTAALCTMRETGLLLAGVPASDPLVSAAPACSAACVTAYPSAGSPCCSRGPCRCSRCIRAEGDYLRAWACGRQCWRSMAPADSKQADQISVILRKHVHKHATQRWRSTAPAE